MPELASVDHLQTALVGLLKKYEVPVPSGWRLALEPTGQTEEQPLVPGWALLKEQAAAPAAVCPPIPLLPWRSERRFVELRRLVESGTVETVLMLRFSCQTDGRHLPLGAVLYRELDLAEWLMRAPIVSVMASINGPAANLVVRLADGTIGSIEANTALPEGSPMLDRHELIARRGVASDRVVDTQVPQSSVYLYGAGGVRQWTDTDAELYGLSVEEIHLVRAAWDVVARPEMAGDLRRQHSRLVRLVQLAFESDRRCQKLEMEGA
jgi:hypothetical protein